MTVIQGSISKQSSGYQSLSNLSTADNFSEPISTTVNPTDRERWKSIVISLAIQFCIMIQNAMFFSNLWPFMKQVDPSTTQSFYGFALTMASLCVAVASPLFGFWANKVQQCKTPLYFGIGMIVVGNLLVGTVESFPSNRKYVLMVGRMFTGIGSGSYAPLFAYIVMATRVDERRTAVSVRAAFATVSTMLGPALASAFVPIGFPGLVIGNFHLDMYSTIAWVNIVISLLLLLVVAKPFKEHWIGVDASQLKDARRSDHEMGETAQELISSSVKLRPYDKVPMLVCFYMRFVYMFMMAIERSIGTAFMMIMFRWSPAEVISYNAIIQLGTGVLDFAGNIFMGTFVLKYVRERSAMLLGLAISLGYFFFSFPWPGLTPIEVPDFFDFGTKNGFGNVTVGQLDGAFLGMLSNWTGSTDLNRFIINSNLNDSGFDFLNITSFTPNSHANFSQSNWTNLAQYLYDDLIGCQYAWCEYTSRVSLWKYIVARAFLILSLSVGFTPSSTLVSKVLGPRKQGTIQGLFAASGQIGLTICPLIMGTTFEYFGPRVSFAIGAAVNLSGLILVGATYKRLLGWQEESEIKYKKATDLSQEEKEPLLAPLDHRNSISYGK